MAFLNIAPNRTITNSSPTFIIAEIGQNHQGDIEIAKKLIRAAKDCGADCVKFQKTCLQEKFNKLALDRPYNSPNSWGLTYGAHKSHLEFSNEQYMELKQFCDSLDILFSASAMDSVSLQFLVGNVKVPFVKIGSGDANNFILLEEAAKTNVPLVISTGMQSLETVSKINETVSGHHKNFALLHCVSSYPTPITDLNLSVLNLYKSAFPHVIIGYSGHELGCNLTPIAVALGAKIIERHLTLDKSWKGSDHQCSLEPNEFKELVANIRQVEQALGAPVKTIQNSEMDCYRKLGKTIVTAKHLQKGAVLSLASVKIKVAEPKGVDGASLEHVMGRKLARDMAKDESITEDCLL